MSRGTAERFIGTSLPVCMTRVGEMLCGTPPADFAMTPRARLAAAGADALADSMEELAALAAS